MKSASLKSKYEIKRVVWCSYNDVFNCSYSGHEQDDALDEILVFAWIIVLNSFFSTGNLASNKKLGHSNSDWLMFIYLPLSLLESPSQLVSLHWPIRLMQQWWHIVSSSWPAATDTSASVSTSQFMSGCISVIFSYRFGPAGLILTSSFLAYSLELPLQRG